MMRCSPRHRLSSRPTPARLLTVRATSFEQPELQTPPDLKAGCNDDLQKARPSMISDASNGGSLRSHSQSLRLKRALLIATGGLALLLVALYLTQRPTHAQTPATLELPWCKDVASGKKVKLKVNIGGFFIEKAEARWHTYGPYHQVAHGEFSFDLQVTGQSIKYMLTVPSLSKHYEGTVSARRGQTCDECDGNNNAVLLISSAFRAWPKRNDRTRILLTLPEGNWEVELDTEE